MEVRVNTLPVRTWNWLSMNESRIKDLEMPDALRIESDGAFSSAIPPLPDMNTGMGIRLDEKVASHPIRVAIPAGDQQKIKVAIRGEAEKRGGQLIEIRAGRESELTVIMELTGEGQGLMGVQTHLWLEEGAKVRLVQVQLMPSAYRVLQDIGAYCESNASLETIQLFLGGSENYSGCYAALEGEGSRWESDLVYLAQAHQRFDMNYVARHRGIRSQSQLKAKGILREHAEKCMRQTIEFVKGAAGAEGTEQEEVLMLSENTINRSIPLILCGEEAVQGNHGASIGRPDEELLFYMQSRGLDMEEIYQMLIRGRIEEICRRIQDPETEQKIWSFWEGGGENESVS